MAACPRCGRSTDVRVLAQSAKLAWPLYRLIQQNHPAWRAADGLCPACVYEYAQQLAATRSTHSLQTATEPNGTFPYYHPDEESVLSQPIRLPDYATFGGQGVTIAFLDSGYYPHPDLAAVRSGPDPMPNWAELNAQQLRTIIMALHPRLIQYVDLTDGGERVGLDQPSLWNGAGDSWHGQMTTVIAAGNGLLSDGYFRGYAHQATLLPIKIGRGGGRIPEEDILSGLQWLLHNDNWQRYGVRVLNVSVGGDFREAWHKNPVCLAAEELSRRGVLICAAAGNRGQEELLAPAQAPSVLTVGGYEDQNLRWRPDQPAGLEQLTLYHHNYGSVLSQLTRLRKPEILALGRWLPSPILPVSPILPEMVTLAAIRELLLKQERFGTPPLAAWLPAVWQGLRQHMNAHKWVHPYYQHVDGTSVSVAQVSAVAAQMAEANPHLTGPALRTLLLETALPLPHHSNSQSGHGLLQPTQAVAAALRAPGGPLVGYLRSATVLTVSALTHWQSQLGLTPLTPTSPSNATRPIYLGYYAPTARSVSLIGTFNDWQPGRHPLQRTPNGWWHGLFQFPVGEQPYRFWVESQVAPAGDWHPDPENPVRTESGYTQDHSVLSVS